VNRALVEMVPPQLAVRRPIAAPRAEDPVPCPLRGSTGIFERTRHRHNTMGRDISIVDDAQPLRVELQRIHERLSVVRRCLTPGRAGSPHGVVSGDTAPLRSVAGLDCER
jgi:hypothetical protein